METHLFVSKWFKETFTAPKGTSIFDIWHTSSEDVLNGLFLLLTLMTLDKAKGGISTTPDSYEVELNSIVDEVDLPLIALHCGWSRTTSNSIVDEVELPLILYYGWSRTTPDITVEYCGWSRTTPDITVEYCGWSRTTSDSTVDEVELPLIALWMK